MLSLTKSIFNNGSKIGFTSQVYLNALRQYATKTNKDSTTTPKVTKKQITLEKRLKKFDERVEKQLQKTLRGSRAKSPYNLFVASQYVNNKVESGTVMQRMKSISEKWKSISPSEKSQYIQKSKEDKARVDRENSELPQKPSKSSPYTLYIAAKASSKPTGVKVTEYFKTLGKNWSSMSDADKEPYIKQSEKYKAATTEKLDKYNQQVEQLRKKIVDNLSKK
ncbi:hypothetical protein DLAC_06626 [Tieghemostelium lacteum]|uniref:HMG box domain-containing protein n=1 Tax=Tieghemostelium lacteum TaxID=361077 RepID=A0A151ZFI5_TIELA|nr:hypothetical protein DLAC_06626 [Tieghemostelium lacteum]|eukprot:KYQ92630.1 hypothetical protein DLAC_06626 [Tieghemostelium lacteum]